MNRVTPLERGYYRLFVVQAVFYLGWVALAETLTTFSDPRVGMAAHCLLLLFLVFYSFRARWRWEQLFLVSMVFAPLIRILSLSLPLTRFPMMYWYLITSIPLFASLFFTGRVLGFSWRELGLNLRLLPLQIFIGVGGAFFGVVEYLILRPEPLITSLDWRLAWGPALILLFSTGLLEEMLFRGLLQRTAQISMGGWGVVYVGVLFAILHIGYRSLLDIFFVLVVGLLFGWIVLRTRSLLGVTLAHGMTNIVLFLIMPFVPLTAIEPAVVPVSPAVVSPVPVLASPTLVPASPSTPTPTSVPPTATPSPTPSPTMLPPVSTPTLSPTPVPSVTILADTLNVRAGPGTGYDVLASVLAGQSYTVLGRDPTGEWWLICCVEDQEGWVHGGFVRFAGDGKAVPTIEWEPP